MSLKRAPICEDFQLYIAVNDADGVTFKVGATDNLPSRERQLNHNRPYARHSVKSGKELSSRYHRDPSGSQPKLVRDDILIDSHSVKWRMIGAIRCAPRGAAFWRQRDCTRIEHAFHTAFEEVGLSILNRASNQQNPVRCAEVFHLDVPRMRQALVWLHNLISELGRNGQQMVTIGKRRGYDEAELQKLRRLIDKLLWLLRRHGAPSATLTTARP